MIIYKCDSCENTHKYSKPERWLEINGQIQNNLPNNRIISCYVPLYFCSRDCFERYFFMTANVEVYRKDIEGYKAAIDTTEKTDTEKRTLFMQYFKAKYDLKKLEPIKDDINGLIDYYFPISKQND